ncbi:MAG: hypothetical protein LW808_001680 [Verrucomicrobiota bacterium]|nr:MAG: hypothetical protein LW808_001680 [Verrucomicrobiota bacterium]
MGLSPIHVIDFEGNLQYGIVEFGAATLKDNKIQGVTGALCRPIENSARVQWHSRFPDNENEASFRTYLPLFVDRRKSGYFAAHHAVTEDRLLRCYQPFPGIQSGDTLTWGPWIDTLKLYKSYIRGLRSYKVGDLIRHFQLQPELDAHMRATSFAADQFHRAVYDAIATAVLLKHFIALFRVTDDIFLLKA